MHEPQTMKISAMVYMTLMCELMEERYGEKFLVMTRAVQEELTMLIGDDILFAFECVTKKFNDPTFSMKAALIEAASKGKTNA